LTGALYLHCRSVEDVLIAGGHVAGAGYVALDVVRIAATLMAAPAGPEDGYARWRLPEPECATRAASFEDEDEPF
jgi:hypothetical protein